MVDVEKELMGNILVNVHIPAIPSHDRKYGYGETKDGLVFPFESPTKVYSGTKTDSV